MTTNKTRRKRKRKKQIENKGQIGEAYTVYFRTRMNPNWKFSYLTR